MKDTRFIELLNLYIDRQITAEETAQLEAEIQAHPKRQAIYRQYCQIHAGTKMAYQSFRTDDVQAPASDSFRPSNVELFESRRRLTNWAYYAGGFAAAACLAIVFVRFNAATKIDASLYSAAPRPVISSPVMQPAAAPVVAPVAPSSAAREYSAMFVSLRDQEQARSLGNRAVQSLFDDNMFGTRVSLPTEASAESKAPSQQSEFAAFQFQR